MDINNLAIFFCVFILGAASGYFSERVGIVNIGINGMMIFGAMMYCIYASFLNGQALDRGRGGDLGDTYYMLAIILAGLSTIVMGAFFGFSTIFLKTDHVIAGTSINLLGSGLGLALTNELGFKLTGNTQLANPFTQYEALWDQGIKLSVLGIVIFVVILMIIFMIILKFTKVGIRYKSIGENPNAADSQGIRVSRYQWCGILLSSVLAGFAGAIFMYTSYNKSFFGEVDGLGYMALAIMITGSWKLPLIFIVSVGFSAFYTFGESSGLVQTNQNILKMVPYIVTIGFLLIFSSFMKGPKFAGQHFDKSKR